MNQKILTRIARCLEQLSPFNEEGFEDNAKKTNLAYGPDLEEIEAGAGAEACAEVVRARLWEAALGEDSPYNQLNGHMGFSIQVGLDAIFAAGLQAVKQADMPDLERTTYIADVLAKEFADKIRQEDGDIDANIAGIDDWSDFLTMGILETIEEVARAKNDGERMVGLIKLRSLCVEITGLEPRDLE